MADVDVQGVSAAPEPAAPSLLTFLIADVRGYTRFTNEHGDEAAARLADRFAGFCEEILSAHDGRVIELRGDEALAVFPSARNALRGAVALQETFKQSAIDDPSLPLTVGMGLDAGEAIPVRGGYRGGALNLAARLCSVAGAGEILASETVIGLARKTEGLAFVDRGQVMLKGLATPVRVLQIAREGEVPDELPPLQPILVTHPTNLPDDPTPFIGREEELARIATRVQDPGIRLVTLTGTGGTGKTRLALQVGQTLLYDFPDGVFFCDLASLTAPDLVPTAIASVLGVKEKAGHDLTEALIGSLQDKVLLLVLDNYEHVLEARSVVARLLDACRDLRILVTSRIPLHLTREHEYPIPPLAVPDPSNLPPPGQLSQYGAVALFIQRAQAVKPGFAVSNENAPAVAEICARLDGLPLAIELAAARIKLFPPQALLQRLDHRLKVLTGGAKDKPTRQQTLRGAIDWSYSLLTDDEQVLFARFSIFVGGGTFEAADAVCNPDGELDLFDGMASLVDKSLIRQDGEDEPRFFMLETVREYAQEKLDASGDGECIRAAHAAFYVSQAQRPTDEAQTDWIGRIEPDIDNLRGAFRTALQTDPAGALSLAVNLLPYWEARGIYSEGISAYEEALAQGDAGSLRERALALSQLAYLHRLLGQIEPARSRAEEGLRVARSSGDAPTLAHALDHLASVALFHGDAETATQTIEEALPIARGSGEAEVLASLLKLSGVLAVARADLEAAREALDEAWTIERKNGVLSDGLYFLGGLAVLRGDANEARARAQEGLALLSTEGEHRFVRPHLEEILARALVLSGDYVAAQSLVRIAAATHLQTGAGICRAHALEAFARLALARGDIEAAVRMLAGARHVCTSLGMTLLPIERLLLEQTEAAARQRLPDAAFARAWTEGGIMTMEEALSYTLDSGSSPEGPATAAT